MANAHNVPGVVNNIRARYRRLFPEVIRHKCSMALVHHSGCIGSSLRR